MQLLPVAEGREVTVIVPSLSIHHVALLPSKETRTMFVRVRKTNT
jgi:hypothetical protein